MSETLSEEQGMAFSQPKEVPDEMMFVFQDLYDSEINFSLSTFWDGGFTVKLGDEMNGFYSEWTLDSMVKAALFLRTQAILRYPDSEFAKKYLAAEDGL